MSESELKPCPFCGGPTYWCMCGAEDDAEGCHRIECDACGLFDLDKGEQNESLEELRVVYAERFNRRSTPEPDEAMVERVAKALHRELSGSDTESPMPAMLDLARAAIKAMKDHASNT